MLKHALRTCYDLDYKPGLRKRVSLGDLSVRRRRSGTYENVQILKKYLRRRNSISWPNSTCVEVDDDASEVTWEVSWSNRWERDVTVKLRLHGCSMVAID